MIVYLNVKLKAQYFAQTTFNVAQYTIVTRANLGGGSENVQSEHFKQEDVRAEGKVVKMVIFSRVR